jgi:predicted DNA-binding protein (MmcQ/YjbR family)
VSEIGFEVLTNGGPARQAPYFAKGRWVTVDLDAADDADLTDWLATAHGIIAAKLTKAVKAEFGLT